MEKWIKKKDGSTDTIFVVILILCGISLLMDVYTLVYIWLKGLDQVIADYFKWAVAFPCVTIVAQITSGTINNVAKRFANKEVQDAPSN